MCVLIHRLGHRRGQGGHKVKMCGSQASATGRVIGDCSLVTGFHGVTGSGLTWGPTVQQLHKVGWKGSQLPILLSQPPAVLNLGRGRTQGFLVLPPRVFLEIIHS